MTIRELTKTIRERNIRFLDLKFIDLPGSWQHMTIPAKRFSGDLFSEGLNFDGSSVRGFQKIHESDMGLKPEMGTVFEDPFMDHPTLSFVCNIVEPDQAIPYSRDPRHVARKAEQHLLRTGIADCAYFGPEAEFYVFDEITYAQDHHQAFYRIDSTEGAWNTGRRLEGERNLGFKVPYKGGYAPVPPIDSLHNLRSKMVEVLLNAGVDVEVHHHEVGTGGQSEIGIRFGTLVSEADTLMKFKYIVKNVARRYGKTATFMPKPIFQDNGSGMHTHMSLWNAGENLFFDRRGYGGLSRLARFYVGGILHHAHSLLAFCAPTTNSYRRLVPGYEAPVHLAYSRRNRSACVRIPVGGDEKSTRIEFRCPDPTCNPYLAFSAMLMAGLDGIEKRIEPPDPLDRDLYELSPEEKAKVRSTPGSLGESLAALEEDHEYLLKGGVFTTDVIEEWIKYKKESELEAVRIRTNSHYITTFERLEPWENLPEL